MARLRATASAARSVLDGREHDGMLDRVGAMICPPTNHQKAYAQGHQKTGSRLAAFTPEMKEAWIKLYDAVQNEMIRAGSQQRAEGGLAGQHSP
jgi:hypothetical protein